MKPKLISPKMIDRMKPDNRFLPCRQLIGAASSSSNRKSILVCTARRRERTSIQGCRLSRTKQLPDSVANSRGKAQSVSKLDAILFPG
mmetsp:Transcript_13397/g.53705  ORF Transcript_13397/g.53705 Transcript_13397/m.53705 type:complete len:88 (-) Transcript_13397:1158-1421(-)